MDDRCAIIRNHFTELSEQYPGLALTKGDGFWIVRGVLQFSASYEGVSIKDNFHVELLLDEDYPNTPPISKETIGRIPKDFHINPNGSLCLGTSLEVRMKFNENRSLLGFVNKQLIPFLFSFLYFQQYGKMPFGELSHGGKGIFEYYSELFNVNSGMVAIELLKILAENNYKGHHDCPCGNGKRLRDCHGMLLQNISFYQSPNEFLYDYVQCLTHLQDSGQKISNSFLSKKLMNSIRKYEKRFEKKNKAGVR